VLTAAHASSTAIYVLLPTRMDTLAVGALLAVFARDPAAWERCRRFARPAMAGAVALLAAIVYRERGLGGEEKLTQMFGYSPIALLAGGAVLSALTASPRSLTGLVWRHPVLRMFGRYSYGMYVWHTFVIWRIHDSMFRDGRTAAVTGSSVAGDLLFVAVALAMTMAVSLASWYVVENPFLRLKRFVPGGRREGQASAWTLSTQPVVVHQNGLETP
jgi:peptidoglycan/LPS O-acetylase OafA/YrhL